MSDAPRPWAEACAAGDDRGLLMLAQGDSFPLPDAAEVTSHDADGGGELVVEVLVPAWIGLLYDAVYWDYEDARAGTMTNRAGAAAEALFVRLHGRLAADDEARAALWSAWLASPKAWGSEPYKCAEAAAFLRERYPAEWGGP